MTDKIENEKLKKLLEQSLDMFYSSDANEILPKEGVERTCVFHIGIYMQYLMNGYDCFRNFNLDCEYNKLGETPKKMYEFEDENGIQPDLILHQRDTDNNLMVVEFKGYWNRENINNDVRKLEYLTSKDSENKYKYQLGALVVLEKSYEDTIKNIEYFPKTRG